MNDTMFLKGHSTSKNETNRKRHIRDYVFSLFVFFLPFVSALTLNTGFTITLSFIFGVLFILLSRFGPKFHRSAKWVLLLWSIALFSLIIGYVDIPTRVFTDEIRMSKFRGLIVFMQLTFCMLLFLSLTNYMKGSKVRINRFIFCLKLGTAFSVIYSFYELLASNFGLMPFININNAFVNLKYGGDTGIAAYLGGFYFPRIRGTFPEPKNFAAYLSAVLPLAWVVWSRTFATFILIALILTLSLSAYAGILVALISMIVLSFIFGIKILRRRIIFVTSIILMLVFALWYSNRENIKTYIEGKTYAYYGEQLALSEELTRERPLLGVGIGLYPFYVGEEIVVTTANAFRDLLAETGFLGFTSMLFFIISIIVSNLFKIKKRSTSRSYIGLFHCKVAIAVLIGYISLIVCRSASGNFYFDIIFWTWSAFVLSIMSQNPIPIKNADSN